MTKWIVYEVETKAGNPSFKIEACELKRGQNAQLAARWRGGRLLSIQSSQRKAESFCRLIELQAGLQGFDVTEARQIYCTERGSVEQSLS